MIKKIVKVLMLFVLFFPALFLFSACKEDESKMIGLSVCLKDEGINVVNNEIVVEYGECYNFQNEDFIVKILYDDGKTRVVEVSNYNLSSEIPDVVITPLGEYDLKFSYLDFESIITVKVVKKTINANSLKWQNVDNLIYNGMAKCPKLESVPGVVQVRYEYSFLEETGIDPINVGEYCAKAELILLDDNYEIVGSVPNLSFTIKKAKINVSSLLWESFDNLIYDGFSKTPKLVSVPNNVVASYIYASNGERVEPVDAGKYEAIVSFTVVNDNYEIAGIVESLSFEIKKSKIDVSNLEWNQTQSLIYDGEMKTIELKQVPKNVKVSYKYTMGESVVEPINAGEYKASVEINPINNNYEVVGSVDSLDFTIAKKKVNVSSLIWENVDNLIYNGTKMSPKLTFVPEGVKVSYVYKLNNEIVDAVNSGYYTADVNVEPLNGNFEIVGNVEQLSFEIQKVKVNVSQLVWENVEDIIYDGSVKNPKLYNLPEGFNAVYTYKLDGVVVEPINSGRYVASVIISAINNNYQADGGIDDLSFEIKKATIGSLENVNLKVNELIYNGEEQIIALNVEDFNNVPEGVEIFSVSGNKGTDVSFFNKVTAVFVEDDSGNYNDFIQSKEFSWIIKPKTLRITVNNQTIQYGEEPTGCGYIINSEDLVEKDKDIILINNESYTFDDYVPYESVVGEYEIGLSGTLNNYAFNVTPGRLIVVPKEVDVSNIGWEDISEGIQSAPKLKDVPEGVSVTYIYLKNGEVVESLNAGEVYVVRAYLSALNSNYNINGELSQPEISFKLLV